MGNQVLDKPDILPVIQQYTSLRKAGKNYSGLCPLHSEKTPSFTVDPNRQRFKCFGCGESGDVLDFVQKVNNTDFKGSLSILGISQGRPYRPNPVEVRKRELVKKYNEWKKQRDDGLIELHRQTLRWMDHAKDKTALQEILAAVQSELSIFDSRDERRILELYRQEVEHGRR